MAKKKMATKKEIKEEISELKWLKKENIAEIKYLIREIELLEKDKESIDAEIASLSKKLSKIVK